MSKYAGCILLTVCWIKGEFNVRFDVLTLFPELFDAVLGSSIIGNARKDDLIDLNFVQIRSYSDDKHRRVDDYPYGGGTGMLMAPQPIVSAYRSVSDGLGYKPYTVYMSPKGTVFNQKKAEELLKKEHIVILCGHYEGVDERVIETIVDEQISIGDFVLTGGEIPAMALIDSVCRMVPGVLAQQESYTGESHYNSLLEYPQYTRPFCFMERTVPEVLLSGHHKNIEAWKRYKSLQETYRYRPDMLKNAALDENDLKYIKKIRDEI